MFNFNNNGNSSQIVWNYMKLFNQLTLWNILNNQNDLRTPELRTAVASKTEEQKNNVLIFLECNKERLAGLPNSCGFQTVSNTHTLLTNFLH